MCGIVAYIGQREAYPILIKGLQRLEYRGYDSAGVALLNGGMNIYKRQGKVSDLIAFTEGKNKSGQSGIGHTRWATHGQCGNAVVPRTIWSDRFGSTPNRKAISTDSSNFA